MKFLIRRVISFHDVAFFNYVKKRDKIVWFNLKNFCYRHENNELVYTKFDDLRHHLDFIVFSKHRIYREIHYSDSNIAVRIPITIEEVLDVIFKVRNFLRRVSNLGIALPW